MQDIGTLPELESLLGFSFGRYYPKETIHHKGIYLAAAAGNLAKLVAMGDPLAIEDACRLISKDPRLPFGKLIKSNLARALRKSATNIMESERSIIIERTVYILSLEYCPREAEDYCKLIKKLGANEAREVAEIARPQNEKSKTLVALRRDMCAE